MVAWLNALTSGKARRGAGRAEVLVIRPARVLLAAADLTVMALFVLWVGAFTDAYGYHLCGWPARITCDGPILVWWLVPIWFGVISLLGAMALLAWAWTGSYFSRALPFPAWTVLFPFLVIGIEPRQVDLSDFGLLGIYGAFGLLFVHQAGVAWFPILRRTIDRIVAITAGSYLIVLLLVPYLLATRWAE